MIYRFFDILLSSLAILALSPVLIPVMIILKLTGEREVFYIQQRVGFGGKPFGVFKFATMIKNSSKMGSGFITTKGDPRVLPVGRVLRKTKINELPQLFNIFIGDMSVVGPRPQVQKHFDLYSEQVKADLNTIKPGLTGIGSIFFRDEESILEKNKTMTYEECYSNVIAPYKGELEQWYIKNRSIVLYFKIILVTAWVVVFPGNTSFMKLFKDIPSVPESLALSILMFIACT